MLIAVSIILIVATTLFVTYYTYHHRKRLTCMGGMMIAMTNAMMSSVSIGTIVGVIYKVDLSTPTIIGVVFGMIVGYITGKPISLMAALDGLGAGIMGGMMGAMLGVMLLPSKVNMMVVFILAIFVIVMIVLVKVIDEEITARVKKSKVELKKPFLLNPSFLIIIVLFIAFSVFSTDYVLSESDAPNDFEVPLTTYNGDSLQAVINVQMFSYEPNNISIPTGESVVLNFKAIDNLISCAIYIYSNDLDFRVKITSGEENFIELGELEPGIYNFACTMNMFSGSVTVY
ncbi:hypothetical protein J2S74_003657 [Evansella vedderi]|uniref:EfeO-type cupredoxin-like domain-containing protein n=1 Tax=Evansella vedderi TaxID=38282 RepID=A0ABT9ZZF8_9BACI|nr:cupredoxin domain-containing protein [Evansella vedderi]MDQ0256239.1 hypothetical protein [Evansella vedderi]